MHPDFQRKYSGKSNQLRLLKDYNKHCKDEYIDMPYTFSTPPPRNARPPDLPHTPECKSSPEDQEPEKKLQYQAAIRHTRGLWEAAPSRDMLKATFQEIGARSARITNIVCFGLGHMNLDKKFYGSTIQHMAVFTIINALNELYRQRDPNHGPIKLILQDPSYRPRDYATVKGLFPYNNTSFVSDPDGLLAINSSTLIVTAYLPFAMPLIQIIADLFAKDPTQGPAAIICDEMELDTGKREYSVLDRASPGVARFLTGHYGKADAEFEYHGLETEFMDDVCGKDWKKDNRYHSLNSMDIWLRK